MVELVLRVPPPPLQQLLNRLCVVVLQQIVEQAALLCCNNCWTGYAAMQENGLTGYTVRCCDAVVAGQGVGCVVGSYKILF